MDHVIIHLAHIANLEAFMAINLLLHQKADWRALLNLFSGKRERI
jgi:hypothetical protein